MGQFHDSVIYFWQKLEDAMQEIGLKIKHHEDNVKFLKSQKNRLDDSILDIRGTVYFFSS